MAAAIWEIDPWQDIIRDALWTIDSSSKKVEFSINLTFTSEKRFELLRILIISLVYSLSVLSGILSSKERITSESVKSLPSISNIISLDNKVTEYFVLIYFFTLSIIMWPMYQEYFDPVIIVLAFTFFNLKIYPKYLNSIILYIYLSIFLISANIYYLL